MIIKLIDLNRSLIQKAKDAGIDAIYGDYFNEGYRQKQPVFVTASNPAWTFGGGIDAIFKQHFPKLVELKQMKGSGMERIANICFTITVDHNFKATRDMVSKAIDFAVNSTSPNETLILSGLGTGIGGLSEEDFIKILLSFN
jgi:hypothetical protein